LIRPCPWQRFCKPAEVRPLRERLHTQLKVLKREFETGQAKLREIEAQQAHLRETLLRISGAIQVLEEELAQASLPSSNQVEQPDGNVSVTA